MGGGIGPAIVGTLLMVGIAALISVPFGLFAAIYLAMLEPDGKIATTAASLAKVLTGFPSILAGVFIYGVPRSTSAIRPWPVASRWRC